MPRVLPTTTSITPTLQTSFLRREIGLLLDLQLKTQFHLQQFGTAGVLLRKGARVELPHAALATTPPKDKYHDVQ